MRIQLRLIIGLLYQVMVGIKKTLGQESPCTMVKLTANCVNKGLSHVPQDLDLEIEGLDLSGNPIVELGEDDFKRYPALTTLFLRNVFVSEKSNESITITKNVFAHLQNLENLDISESAFKFYSVIQEIIWPTKLKRLSIGAPTKETFLDLDLSNLYLLEDLNASSNQISNFPKLHPEAPVYWIDLFNNPLNNVTAEHIAPYCLLRYLRMSVPQGGKLNTISQHCPCRRLEEWMILHHISGFDFSCAPHLGTDKADDCPVKTFSDKMFAQRKACLLRQPTSKFWKWVIGATLLSLLVPALYIGIPAYKRYRAKKETATSNSDGPESGAAVPSTEDVPPPDTEGASDPSPE